MVVGVCVESLFVHLIKIAVGRIVFLFLSNSSFHKKSTRNFLLKLIREDWGFPESEVVAEMRFDIPKSYNFHKAKTKDVEVDLIRIFVGGENKVDDDKTDAIIDSDKIGEDETIGDENRCAEEEQLTDDRKEEGEAADTL